MKLKLQEVRNEVQPTSEEIQANPYNAVIWNVLEQLLNMVDRYAEGIS